MTSTQDSKCLVLLEERRRSPLDQLPPPANSDKPLTPFSIEDILNKPSVRRSCSLSEAVSHISPEEKLPSGCPSLTGRALLRQSSPLCALEELASKTFIGLEVSVLQAAEGKGRLFFISPSCCMGFLGTLAALGFFIAVAYIIILFPQNGVPFFLKGETFGRETRT